MSLTNFAAEDGPHISLRAEEIFQIGSLHVTNAMIYGTIITVALIIFAIVVGKKASYRPQKGIIQWVEMMMEFMINLLTPIFNSPKKAAQYAPTFATFFFFIVISNVSGLLPIVGEGITVNGSPLFRPPTADLNVTVAMSIIAILMVQYYSIKESGFGGHLKHYFTDKPFNPINMFIGFLEVFGELTRILSLSLRLFLNTAVGEILIAVFAFVGSSGAAFTLVPIVLFEILVALIQAYVFTVLAATYLGLAINHGDEHHAEELDHSMPKLSPSEVG